MTSLQKPIIPPENYQDVNSDELVTGEAVLLDVRPTSFVFRALGAIIDLIVHVLVLIMFLMVTGLLIENGLIDATLAQAFSISSMVLAFVAVPIAVELTTRGRSLGKIIVGARIVRSDGGAIQFRHSLIRALTGVLEIVMTLGGLAAIVALVSDRTRRVGDLLAGTYSQYERAPDPAKRQTILLPAGLSQWAQTADVGRLPASLSRKITRFIIQAPAMFPESRHRLSQELLAAASPYVFPMPDAPPEAILAAVVAMRRERDLERLQLQDQQLAKLEPTLRAKANGFPNR